MICLSSREAIASVQKAESEAAAIRARAQQEAAEKIEQNEKACTVRMARAVAAAEAELAAKLADVQKRADALIEQSREEAVAEAEEGKNLSRARMRDAVKMIVWEMHNSCQ